jgi:hypothetical protein
MAVSGYIFFFIGSIISVINFYLSFPDYPVFRMRGGKKEDYRRASGFPAIGSALVLLGYVSFIPQNMDSRFRNDSCLA